MTNAAPPAATVPPEAVRTHEFTTKSGADTIEVGRKLALLKPTNSVAPSTHPCSFALAPDGKTLYVALANRDAVAAVNVGGDQFAVKGYFDTRLPGQSYFGAEPLAVALNGNGSRLYVAEPARVSRSASTRATHKSRTATDTHAAVKTP